MKVENMLLVGSAARNTGKTTLCTGFIEKYKQDFDIIGLKVTTIHGEKGVCHHGTGGCGVCTSIIDNYEIVEETSQSGEKDTQKLLAAGAKKVFWIRALKGYIEDAFKDMLSLIPKSAVIVCESNSLTNIVTPGVLVLMHKSGIKTMKQSALEMVRKADVIADITNTQGVWPIINKIEINKINNKFFLKYCSIYKDFTLIILAGGKSSRMGQDKAQLTYNGVSFLDNLVIKGRLAGFNQIIVSGCNKEVLGAENVMDELTGRGPLGGLHACLKKAKSPFSFVVTVDVPKLDFDALVPMAQYHMENKKPATVLVTNGKLDPLIGVYNSNLYNDIHMVIKEKPQRIRALLDRVTYGVFDFHGDCEMLDNINTPDDYAGLSLKENP